MTNIQKNTPLKNNNTFHLQVIAKFFIEAYSTQDIIETLTNFEHKNLPILILGDGANILFTKDFGGLVIKNSLKGKKIIEENDDYVVLEVGSGENWHDLVTYAVLNNWSGIENLAYIPGTVGASPVQNIGAYGQSLEETFVSLDAIELSTKLMKTFTKDECHFKYRDSIFKQELKNKFCITAVRLKLSKNFQGINTTYHSRYESIENELKNLSTPPYNLNDIYNAVIRIRQKKLPDVNKVGTAGSTFANPLITKLQLLELQKKVPNVQFYPVDKMQYPNIDDPSLKNAEIVKVSAGWLLEESSWRNKRIGNVGTHSQHALCVVAYDGATPKELYSFTEMMRDDFRKNYCLDLSYEVNVI